jgi:hypothetical protein
MPGMRHDLTRWKYVVMARTNIGTTSQEEKLQTQENGVSIHQTTRLNLRQRTFHFLRITGRVENGFAEFELAKTKFNCRLSREAGFI